MFTGIIEALAEVTALEKEGENLHIDFNCSFSHELKVDQSVAHNGVCLTVVRCDAGQYRVTAILETLRRSNLGRLQLGDKVNVERCMKLGARLDGHLVQGHVDATAKLKELRDESGSWVFRFEFDEEYSRLLVPKGSITVNGVSLTVVEAGESEFTVAIIPYTYAHTTFHRLQPGDEVNLEFDVIGKYVERMLAPRLQS